MFINQPKNYCPPSALKNVAKKRSFETPNGSLSAATLAGPHNVRDLRRMPLISCLISLP
jgi:hypothetical protein